MWFSVRGVEDLGGGLQAGFWIEGQLTNDDGNAAGLNFQRRSTVSLMGGFGEIRLGRDYTTHFWNTTVYDPFGTNGVGSANTFAMLGAANANVSTAVRSNNAISYFTPNLGGFSAQLQYAFGEQVSGGVKTNNFMGFRLGYAAGPISVHGAYGKTEGATDAVDHKAMNFGGSCDPRATESRVSMPSFSMSARSRTSHSRLNSRAIAWACSATCAG